VILVIHDNKSTTLRVVNQRQRLTARAAGGTVSLVADVVGATPAPVNTALPVITGTFRGGETLTVSDGTWTGSPSSYAYQWLEDGSPIVGATTNSLTLTAAQIPTLISCTVTATNAGGSTDATADAVSSPLRPIYQIDPNAAVFVHTQGIAASIGAQIDSWNTADGAFTLTSTGTQRPYRYADGADFDGNDDRAICDALGSYFGGPHSVALSARYLSTANNTRTVWSVAEHFVSTTARNIISQNLALGTAATLLRLRVLIGGTSIADQIDMQALYALGSGATFTTGYTSPDKDLGGTAEAYQLDSTPTLLDTGTWPTNAFTPGLFTVGCERLNTTFSPSNFWLGTLASIVVLSIEATDAQMGIIYDALDAEGAL